MKIHEVRENLENTIKGKEAMLAGLREDNSAGYYVLSNMLDINIEELKKIPEITECYYITGSYTLYVKMIAKNHEHMRKILYEQIDSIPGIAKTDSIIELGCAFKRNISL